MGTLSRAAEEINGCCGNFGRATEDDKEYCQQIMPALIAQAECETSYHVNCEMFEAVGRTDVITTTNRDIQTLTVGINYLFNWHYCYHGVAQHTPRVC